jgi:hypothetical protein
MIRRCLSVSLAALLLAAPAFAQQTRADAEKDPVLQAMLAELDRSKSELQLKGFEKPFFIQYRIEDIEDYQTKGDFGASVGEDRRRQRLARVTVRVGDYKTDSSTPRGDGAIQLAALDNDPLALRASLWEATDQAYKAALKTYAQKQSQLKQIQTPPQQDDFSHESPVISLGEIRHLAIKGSDWVKLVCAASGLYLPRPRRQRIPGQQRRHHPAQRPDRIRRVLRRRNPGRRRHAPGPLLWFQRPHRG